ncbi:MAG TPA: UvrD-helicase domain-containing protein [Candidatus Cybelea sp.]
MLAELSVEQREAVDRPHDECFAILGAPGSGKSTALVERAAALRAIYPNSDPLFFAPDRALDEFAVEILRACDRAVTLVDDVDAELLFAQACAPLFALEWSEFSAEQLDPEVPGLRSPERFLRSAFRLIRRLRDADATPAFFLSHALTGATEFYARPPNFADPALLSATKHSYHDSLAVTPQELTRQRRREIDLAKILSRLFERYVELVESTGRMTGRDAAIAAAAMLERNRDFATTLRERHQFAFVDDAQELTKAHLRLLRAVFGDRLGGVTLCGDPSSVVSEARMTNPRETFAFAAASLELHGDRRAPAIELERLPAPREEAALIAARVAEWIEAGTPPERIAVIFRSVRNVERYEEALLERNVPVLRSGDVNVFTDRRALDALALLWNVYDPFRHEWLLRTLGNRAFGLSDASLAALCGEPPDPQRALFAFDDEPAPTVRTARWNPKRDLRLGWNVIRGERDDALGEDAAARVRRFRSLRERWLAAMHELPFERFARLVWSEGLARDGEPGSARSRAQQATLRRLLQRLTAFLAENSGATIADVLEYGRQRMESDLETCQLDEIEGFVHLLSVEATRGREFERVVVANVRPGGFPRWYAPDAFLFSPRYGMIPKDNVGDARAARTAKFSYYLFRSKAPQQYYERERRAFRYAVKRAGTSVLVTAGSRPIRSKAAPELLEELR